MQDTWKQCDNVRKNVGTEERHYLKKHRNKRNKAVYLAMLIKSAKAMPVSLIGLSKMRSNKDLNLVPKLNILSERDVRSL